MIDASAFQLLLMVLTGWLARRERELVDYLIEENRCLRRQPGTRRVRVTDDDSRRLAARAYRVTQAAWSPFRRTEFAGRVKRTEGLILWRGGLLVRSLELSSDGEVREPAALTPRTCERRRTA